VSIDLNPDAVPRTLCPRCASDVPAGDFCGVCGSDLTGERTGGRRWLRPGTFGAAPGEAVLRPYLFSSLFPHLPNRSRRPFRIILLIGSLALVAFALARIPSAGIALAALGLPLLLGSTCAPPASGETFRVHLWCSPRPSAPRWASGGSW
jgi:hypothetical protein